MKSLLIKSRLLLRPRLRSYWSDQPFYRLFVWLLFSLAPCSVFAAELPVYGYEVVATYAHDPRNFTQGLVIEQGVVYEGTGRYGESRLLIYDLASGKLRQAQSLQPSYFGEGIALTPEHIYQLTYREQQGFIYARDSLQLQSRFTYSGEGWGLTYDGQWLIKSNGSAELDFVRPADMQLQRRCQVTALGQPVTWLNELEFIDGQIYANVWQTSRVAIIDASSCEVRAWLELSGLLTPAEAQHADVLNGIAYDRSRQQLYVTGKYWPWLFAIKLKPVPAAAPQ